MKKTFFSLAVLLIASLAQATPPQLDPTKLMAVHITNFAPKGGVMIPGLGGTKVHDPITREILVSGEDNLRMQAKLPWRRITLHWSLGAPLDTVDLPERRVDWTARKYAVLEPLNYLLDRSLGGRFNDWHTFGPHALSDEAVMFVPKAESDSRFDIKTISYDPSKQNVCEAVLSYLKAQKLPILELDFATSPELFITKYNYKKVVAMISGLSKETEKSWIIKKIYDQYLEMGADGLEAHLISQINQVSCIKMADEHCIGQQKIFVNGEVTDAVHFLGPVTFGQPKIHFGFTNHFVFAKIKSKLTEVFDRTIQFRAAEAIPHSREKYGCSWHEQLEPENKETVGKQRKAIACLEELFKQVPKQLPKACQKAGELWVKGLKIWVAYVAKHRLNSLEKGTPFYSQSDDKIANYLKRVVSTVNNNSVKPLLALYKVDLARKYGFDFLSTKHPDLVKEAEKELILPSDESLSEKELQISKEIVLGDLKKDLALVAYDPKRKYHKDCISADLSRFIRRTELAKLIEGHENHGFYKVFLERAKREEMTCFEDVLLGAEYLYQRVADEKKQDSAVAFLGRSPYLHELAYEALCDQMQDEQNILHISYSGCADVEKRSKDTDPDNSKNIVQNIVTKEKLEHYFAYLDKKNIGELSHLYLVDIMSSGCGLNSFIRALQSYCKSREIVMPDITFAYLHQVYVMDNPAVDKVNLFYNVRHEGKYCDNKWRIEFQDIPRMNYKGFNVNSFIIPTNEYLFDEIMDSNLYQEFVARGIFYPAQRWTKSFDEARKKGGHCRAKFESYFKRNAKNQIAWHMKKYKIQPLVAPGKAKAGEEDQFNFLRTKYPDLVQKAEGPILTHEQEKVRKNQYVGLSVSAEASETLESKAEHYKPVAPDLMLPAEKAVKLHHKSLELYEQGHDKRGFFKPFFERQKEETTGYEKVLLEAEYMYQTVENNQDDAPVILFVGRSPYLHLMAYEELVAQTNNPNHRVEHVCFSGAPDAETNRSEHKNRKEAQRLKDLVTPEKLVHYLNYLKSLKLEEASKIYIVDMVSTGGNLNAFLRILKAYFQQENIQMPEVNLMNITIQVLPDLLGLHETCLFSFERQGQYSDNNWKTRFPERQDLNVHPVKLRTYMIPNHPKIHHNLLDRDPLHYYLARGIEYPAQRWKPEYDEMRDKGGMCAGTFEELFKSEVRKIIASHMKKYSIQAFSGRD